MSTKRLGVLAALTLLPLLAGCSPEATGTGDKGYVSGNGIVTVLPVSKRESPGPVKGRTIDGEPLSLEDYAGKIVVINVWGSWCAPCRAEAPALVEAANELDDENVAFLGINTRDPTEANAAAFVRQYGVPYPSLYDEAGRTLLAFRRTLPLTAIPSTAVIDEEGRVAATIIGETTKSTLMGVVREVQEGS